MQYKGEDLDLRVPYGRAGSDRAGLDREPAPGRWMRPSAGSGEEPIWVDELVLQCCNYAFELAYSHDAAEVGLEHLVHALSRVDSAARVLEARGVREGQLRRDSAALLASEIAAPPVGERHPPRRAAAVEQALRRAGERAQRRGLPTSVDDLLWSLLHSGVESPAILLLRRLTPDWQRSDWARSPDTSATQLRMLEPMRSTPSTTYSEPGQLRVGTVEEAIRHIHAELVGERRTFLDLVRELHRDVLAQRGEQAAFRSDVMQRIDAMERSLEVRGDGVRVPIVAERMQALERAVHGGLGEGARNWAALGQKMHVFNQVAARIETIERALEKRSDDGDKRWSQLVERLDAIGSGAMLRLTSGDAESNPVIARLEGLERAVRSGFGETVRLATDIGGRLETADNSAREQRAAGEDAVLMLDERLNALEALIKEHQPQSASGLADQILERMTALEARFANQIQPMAAQTVKLTAPMADRFSHLEQQIATRAEENGRQLREIAERLASRDAMVQGVNGAATDPTQPSEMHELHEAIVRLAENQHTLASAVADWRHEVQTDLGDINGRMEKLIAVMAPAVPGPPPLPFIAPVPDSTRPPAPTVAAMTMAPPHAASPPVAKRSRWRSVRHWWHPDIGLGRVNQETRRRLERLQQQLRAMRLRRRDRS